MRAAKFLTFAIPMFIFVSCKKNDFQNSLSSQESVSNSESSIENSVSKPRFSDWETVSAWSNDKVDSVTDFLGTISDSAITSEIVNNGLVLLFINTGSAVESLPYQKGNIEWYYQVSTKGISITAHAAAGSSINKDQSFLYVLLSNDQLNDLAGRGITKSQLLNSSYMNAVNLLQ